MKVAEYKVRAVVIRPLMSSGSFWKSAMAARGIPKFEAGPQKSNLRRVRKPLLRVILGRAYGWSRSNSGRDENVSWR